MARRNAGMGVSCVAGLLLLVIMLLGPPAAAAPAPAPSVDCSSVVLTLSDCLGFVTGTDKSPPTACCKELATVVKNSPQCLCLLFNTTFTEPLGVNVTRAQELPSKCKVQTPPTSLCSQYGIPVPGPASPATAPSPAASSPGSASTPTAASSPSPTGSAPSGTTSPSGSPAGLQPNVSSVPPPSPNGAHLITSRSAGAAASLFLLAGIFLS